MSSALPALLGQLGRERRAIVATIVAVTISLLTLAALVVLPAFALGRAVVLGTAPPAWFWLVMGGLVLLRGLLTWVEMDASHSLAYRVLAQLRLALFDRYAVALPTRRRENAGLAAATAMTDTERLEFFYAHTIAQLVAAAVNTLAGLAVLALLRPRLAEVVLLALACLAATVLLGRRRLRALGARQAEQHAALSGRVVDLLGGLREVLGYHLQRQVRTELAVTGAAAATTAGRLETANRLLAGVREAVVTAAAIAVLAVAAVDGIAPEHLAGLVVLALVTIAPAADAAATLGQLHPLRASAERVHAELTRPPVVAAAPASAPLAAGPLGLTFRDVGFGYDDRRVLQGFDLEVAPGEWVGIAGPSGAGKSTVVALAGRLWDPDAGSIELRTVAGPLPLTAVADPELRAAIGVVEQDGHLFSGTVADNLLGGTDATPQELADVLVAVGLADVIAPDDVIGEGGTRLSGGQHARLRLARAVLRRPRILVVDEPTADLDAEAAARVTGLLGSLDCTVVVVSHRPSTLAAADRVVSLVPTAEPRAV